jgi:hypothetical protein
VAAEASAYANPAPPQGSKREHEFSSLHIHHTSDPHLPLDGTGDINLAIFYAADLTHSSHAIAIFRKLRKKARQIFS